MSIKLDLGSEWVLIREESYNQTELLEALKKVILDEEQKKLLVYDAAERGFIDVVSYYVDKISEEEKDEEFYNCLLLQTLYCKEKTYELFCEVLKLVKIDEISNVFSYAAGEIIQNLKNPRSYVKALLNVGYTFTNEEFEELSDAISNHGIWFCENFIEIFSYAEVFDKLSDIQKRRVAEVFTIQIGDIRYERALERINLLNTKEYEKFYSYMLTQNLSQENLIFLAKLRLSSSPIDMTFDFSKFSKKSLENLFSQVERIYVISVTRCEAEDFLSYYN